MNMNFIISRLGQYRLLLENFISLSVLQFANYLLPLITLPYLVRILGPETFGVLAFATSLVIYFNLITDYGFNLTATRDISVNKQNHLKIEEIFSSVLTIKIILFFFCFLILSIIVLSVEYVNQHALVYYATFAIVLGETLFPVWFFQGVEKMRYITLLNLLSKSIFTIAIFCFIKQEADYFLVPIFNSVGSIIAGISSLIIINQKFNVSFQFQRLQTLKNYCKDGWHIFVSEIGMGIYKNSSVFILGVLTSNLIVGYFSIAKKIIDAFNKISVVVSRTIFPYINSNFKHLEQVLVFLKKLTWIIIIYTFIIFIFILLFNDNIVSLIAGDLYQTIIVSLKIMAIVPFVIGLNIPAVHLLLFTKNDVHFSNSLLLGSFIHIILLFITIPFFGYIGAAWSVLITEVVVTVVLYYRAIPIYYAIDGNNKNTN